MSFKEGSTVTMLFHCAGEVSEEEYTVVKKKGKVVTLDTSQEFSECYQFDTDTGRCLNDNTYLGCRRELKV
jgi:hypothetical protein